MTDKLAELGMTCVTRKTTIACFGKQYEIDRSPEEVTVLGAKISYADKMKYLGTTTQSDKGRPSLTAHSDLLIGKTKGVVSRIRSIRKTLSEDENSTIIRATTLGMIMHNSEVMPKFNANENTRFNKLFFAGLRNSHSPAWWYKSAINIDNFKDKDILITKALVKAKCPSNFLARLNGYVGLIFKLLYDARSSRMRNVLYYHLVIAGN